MALSTAAKAGIGGSLGTVAIGGPAATYYAWDYITLYEVEREVLEKDFRLITTYNDSSKKITIEAPTETDKNPRLEKDNSWSCEITKAEGPSDVDVTIKADLDNIFSRTGDFSETARKAKNDLVKACSKHRDESIPSTDKKVVGTLKVKKEEGQFVFIDQPQLNYLLKPTLYEVEEKVSSLNVKLKKGVSSEGNPVILTVDTTTQAADGFEVLDSGYSWSCEITISTSPSGSSATDLSTALWGKLEKNLPTGAQPDTNKDKKLENKVKFVKACLKNRKTDGLTYKSVVGKLTASATGSTSNYQFSIVDHSELDSLLKSN